MKKKVFGFSLIEVLVVIGILAILILIVIPNVSRYIDKGKNSYNESLEEELVLIGKDFYGKNKNKLPRGTSYSKFISLSELESFGLVSKEFVDSDNGKCRDDSYVRVIRDFKTGEYSYYGCLNCENYKSKNQYCNISDFSRDYDFKCDIISTPLNGWHNSYKVDLSAYNNIELYKAYYFDHSYDEIINSTSYFKSLDINNYSSKLIKDNIFSVWIEDIAGNIEKCSKKIDFDISEPICKLSDNRNGYAKVVCEDEEGSGCSASNPTLVKITNGVASAIVKDNAGNVGECQQKFDIEPPVCKVEKEPSSDWTNKNVTVKGTCLDVGGSGCVNASVSVVIKNEGVGEYSPGKVCDKAGNCTTCEKVSVKIDKTRPTCKVVKNPPNVWANTDVIVSGSCYDTGGSGCSNSSVVRKITKEGKGKYSPGQVCDNAGNCATCSEVFVNIDKTAPTCSVVKVPSAEWATSDVKLTGTCSDKGGSECVSTSVDKTFTKEGTGTYSPGNVCDNAGNCSTCSKKSVKIDKTAPTCGGAVRNGNADNGNIRFKYTFNDNLSGVYAEKHGHCYKAQSHIAKKERCSYSTPTSRMNDAKYKTFSSPNTTVTRNYNYNYGSGTVMIYFKLKDVAGNEGVCTLLTPPKSDYTCSYQHSW